MVAAGQGGFNVPMGRLSSRFNSACVAIRRVTYMEVLFVGIATFPQRDDNARCVKLNFREKGSSV